jgi:hypothetical protein
MTALNLSLAQRYTGAALHRDTFGSADNMLFLFHLTPVTAANFHAQ